MAKLLCYLGPDFSLGFHIKKFKGDFFSVISVASNGMET